MAVRRVAVCWAPGRYTIITESLEIDPPPQELFGGDGERLRLRSVTARTAVYDIVEGPTDDQSEAEVSTTQSDDAEALSSSVILEDQNE